MRHVEGLLLIRRTQEVLYSFLQLLSEQQLQRSVQDLVPFIPEKRGTAGVSVDDDSVVGLIDADQHDRAAAIGPILQNDLLLKIIIVLDCLVDLIIHVLIIFNGLEIVDIETCDLLTVGNATDILVTLLHLLSDLNATSSNLVQLLEIRVIFVEDAPKLQVNQGSLFKLLKDQVFFPFHS